MEGLLLRIKYGVYERSDLGFIEMDVEGAELDMEVSIPAHADIHILIGEGGHYFTCAETAAFAAAAAATAPLTTAV